MTRIVLKNGSHVDVDLAAHTLIAMNIEHTRRGQKILCVAGHAIRLDEIDTIVPGFFLDHETAAKASPPVDLAGAKTAVPVPREVCTPKVIRRAPAVHSTPAAPDPAGPDRARRDAGETQGRVPDLHTTGTDEGCASKVGQVQNFSPQGGTP